MKKSKKLWIILSEVEASPEITNLPQEVDLKTTEEGTKTKMLPSGVAVNQKRDHPLSKELTPPTNNHGAIHNHKKDIQEKQCPQKT